MLQYIANLVAMAGLYKLVGPIQHAHLRIRIVQGFFQNFGKGEAKCDVMGEWGGKVVSLCKAHSNIN